jgi:hypothetical protein
MERVAFGDSAKMQAVTQVNVRRGPETCNVDADPPTVRRRPALRKKQCDKRIPRVRRGKDNGMHRRDAQEAWEADGDSGGNRNGQPARARPGRFGGGEARSSAETG